MPRVAPRGGPASLRLLSALAGRRLPAALRPWLGAAGAAARCRGARRWRGAARRWPRGCRVAAAAPPPPRRGAGLRLQRGVSPAGRWGDAVLFVWSLALGLLSSFFSFSLPCLSRNLPETRGGERQEPPQQREQRRGGAAGPLRGAGFGGKELEDADSSPETHGRLERWSRWRWCRLLWERFVKIPPLLSIICAFSPGWKR